EGVVADAVAAVDAAVVEADAPGAIRGPRTRRARPVPVALHVGEALGIRGRLVPRQVEDRHEFLPGGQAPALAERGASLLGGGEVHALVVAEVGARLELRRRGIRAQLDQVADDFVGGRRGVDLDDAHGAGGVAIGNADVQAHGVLGGWSGGYGERVTC